MIISLRYSDNGSYNKAAAFIRSDSPLHWLQELSRWKIDIDHCSLFILPQSKNSPLVAGLFVIFNDTANLQQDLLLDAYRVVADKLFIPLHAEIFPVCSEAELKQILIWDLQVYHPSIGLVGFEEKDKISVDDLFIFPSPLQSNWTLAHPGNPSHPGLQEIRVLQQTPDDIIDSIKNSIDAKPLAEIPGAKDSKRSITGKTIDLIKYGLLKLLKGGLGLFNVNAAPANGAGTGALAQLQQWLDENIEELEKKRQDEIQRLLRMFDDDNDEALRYAIPLDSPYLDRGKSQRSSSLTRRSLNWNFSNLGGGGAVDSWDIGDHYQSLRSKYLASAQRQIDQGDYKKAAYIYAHLLHDFNAAANALVQGKYFREAATLYKDHLKNTKAAAECLEKGGLVLEAIELFKELDDIEKVGDLYQTAGQSDKANLYFEKTTERFVHAGNHLEASRILHKKMYEDERAKQVLLDGWANTSQPENCLKRYFDLVSKTEEDQLGNQINRIYRNAPTQKHNQFLNVLYHVHQHHASEELKERNIEIAYEIASQRLAKNDFTALSQLKQFVPEDKLLPSDVSRYVHAQPARERKPKDTVNLQLDPSITWITATMYHDQILVVGTRDNGLHLARCNWYNNIEYYSWPLRTSTGERFMIVANPECSTRVMFIGSQGARFQNMLLQWNKYFQQGMTLTDLGLLPEHFVGITMNTEGNITILNPDGKAPTLDFYNVDGSLNRRAVCLPLNGNRIEFDQLIPGQWLKLVMNYGVYYTACDFVFLSIDEKGQYSYFKASSEIMVFAISKLSSKYIVVVCDDQTCVLLDADLQLKTSFILEDRHEDRLIHIVDFISEKRFVLIESNRINSYEISDSGITHLMEFRTSSPVISVLPFSERDKFGIVEENGSITRFEI